MPRARLDTADGKTAEWRSSALRAYQRRTLAADALIASSYLAGTNTRRVRRALAALFGGTVGKDTVSRTWRKVKSDWDAWNARSLAEEPIVRLILDGTVVCVRLDRKATSISLLVVLGVRADGQKVLLAIKSMGGESAEAWRSVLDDLVRRGLRRPEFLIVDGAPDLVARSREDRVLIERDRLKLGREQTEVRRRQCCQKAVTNSASGQSSVRQLVSHCACRTGGAARPDSRLAPRSVRAVRAGPHLRDGCRHHLCAPRPGAARRRTHPCRPRQSCDLSLHHPAQQHRDPT